LQYVMRGGKTLFLRVEDMASADQPCLGASKRVRAVIDGSEAEFFDPPFENLRGLSLTQVWRAVDAARQQEVIGLQRRRPDPPLHGVADGATGHCGAFAPSVLPACARQVRNQYPVAPGG